MKRRSLGLLLAFVLTLSLVFGAVSFADDGECQHENTDSYTDWDPAEMTYKKGDINGHLISGPAWTIVYCIDCGDQLSREEITLVDREEGHSWDVNGVCEVCGYENDCEHEHTYTYCYPVSDDYNYVSIDDAHHKMVGDLIQRTYCEDCGLTLEEKEVSEAPEEYHSYTDGICDYCGHKNACTHPNMGEPYLSWNPDDCDYESVDDAYHHVTGVGEMGAYCEDCESWVVTKKDVEVDETELHEYDEEGKCWRCGHENGCTHENMPEPSRSWNPDDCDYESVDDAYHHVTGVGELGAWCPDCQTNIIIERDVPIDETELHEYDEEGVCWRCGHENGCTHENKEESYLCWDPDGITYKSIDDEHHRVTGVGYKQAWCPDCQTDVITEKDVPINEIQEHYYHNGKCEYCGHKNPCKHPDLEGPYTHWWDWDQLEYTPVDDHYHRITGPGYTYTYCPDCGERNTVDENVELDELQEHNYENGVCQYCGHENECTHPHTENPEVSWNPDEVDYTPINNLYHHVTGTGFMKSYCPDCGTYVIGEETEVDVKERHELWNGECYFCGHKTQVDEQVSRIFGADRYTTSRKVADELKNKLDKDKFDAVILANGKNYPDALAGSYLSVLAEAPILLVNSNQNMIDEVQTYIKANLKEDGKIYMLGGSAVVPDTVVSGLSGYDVKRLGGKDRYETNIKILEEAATYGRNYTTVVCTGKDFADSLSAAAVGRPILLVGKSLNSTQKDYLERLGRNNTFCIIGGTGAVNKDIEKTLRKDYGDTWRIAGKDRYETSVNVAAAFCYDGPSAGVLAYGKNFPDGLCGGALAAAVNGPLILTTSKNTAKAIQYAAEWDVHFGYVLGGETLISDKAAKDIFHLKSSDKIIVK